MRPFLHSLRGRILASVILVHAVVTGLIAWEFVSREKSFLGSAFQRQAQTLARSLATAAAAGLVSRDRDSLDALTDSVREAPHLAFALVLDGDGRVLASTEEGLVDRVLTDADSRALLAARSPEVREHGGVVDAVMPVTLAGRVIGFVRIALSRTALEAEIRALVWKALAYTLLAIALGGVVAFLVAQAVTRRLERLSLATHAVAEGRLDVAIVPDPTLDEVGALSRDFAHMVEALRAEQARRNAAEQLLWEEKELAQVTLDSIGDAVITTDMAGQITFMNPVAERLTGWSTGEARGRPLAEVFRILDETSRQSIANPVEVVLATGTVVGLGNHTILLTRDGRELNIEDSAAPIRDREGGILGVVLVFHDVTEAHELQARMRWAASHDPLTALYNRAEFESRLAGLLARMQPGESHVLLYVDLDQFKVINDTCGHAAGDELLRRLAVEMSQTLRPHDVLARLGGDEFGVILPYTHRARARAVAEDLLALLANHRFAWEGRTFTTGASIGLVAITEPGHGVGELLAAADTACYAAKEEGRGRIVEYSEENLDFRRRAVEMDWVARLTEALDRGRFRLYFQPIVPVTGGAGTRHGEILLRLIEADGTVTAPGAFLPAAERYQFMGRIDRWVVENALGWLAGSHEDLCLSINLSGQTLADEQFLAWALERLDTLGVDCRRVCFEITETAAIAHLGRALAFMRALKQRGCRFGLDDFGSGLSSFAYLRTLPVDFIKIDGRFVRRIAEDAVDRAMVEAVRDVARVMHMETVAEYVEDAAILGVLRELGVDYAQGWAVGKPLPLEDVAPSPKKSG